MKLAEEIYRMTERFPKEEMYGLTSQMRRAAVSVPSNIAEGAARDGGKEFLHFLQIARGSLSELETQLLLAMKFGYVDKSDSVMATVEKLFGLIGGLINSVKENV